MFFFSIMRTTECYYLRSHLYDVSDPYASQNGCLKRHLNMTEGSRIQQSVRSQQAKTNRV